MTNKEFYHNKAKYAISNTPPQQANRRGDEGGNKFKQSRKEKGKRREESKIFDYFQQKNQREDDGK